MITSVSEEEKARNKEVCPVPRILHVDDIESHLEIFQLFVRDNFDVVPTSDPSHALDLIQNEHFDAIITDYDMPGMDGLELLEKIKKSHPEMPVIFYTGQGNEEIARKAFLFGASDYIVKDSRRIAHREKLIHTIRQAIERRKTQIALKESKENYRAIWENSPIGICLTDLHGVYRLVNPMYTKIFGYKEEHFTGRHFWDVIISPENRNVVKDEYEANFKKNNLASHTSLKAINFQGDIIDIDLSVDYVRLSDKTRYMVRMVSDVTKHKKKETLLRLMQFAVENAPDGAYWMDEEGNFIYVNRSACRNTGFTREELLKMGVRDMDVNAPENQFKITSKLLREKGPRIFESIHRRKDGTTYPVEVNAAYMHFENKEFYFSMARDLTRRKAMEKELTDRNRELLDYANTVAHDLKSPANLINMYLAQLEENPGTLNSCIATVRRQANYMMDFIDNLLTLSKAGKVADQMQELSLSGLVREAASLLPDDKTRIQLKIEEPIPRVLGDPTMLIHVFSNILENAIKYRGENREKVTVTLSAHEEGDKTHLVLTDDGMGIDPRYKEKIFNPGWVLKKRESTGFGLSIARKIINGHQGQIWATSKGIGQGTSIHILLTKVSGQD